MGKVALFLAVMAIAGCVSSRGQLPSDPRSIWCYHNSPRRDAKPDTQRAELNEINKHNLQGAAWCGWKP